jgi:glyoxylase-like metal-dependent hydrolase (beta-lactamase superfamily II)
MIFRQIKVGMMGNFSYIIGDNGEAAIVDPGWQHKKLLKACEDLKLSVAKILLTHAHYDHVMDLAKVAKKTNAGVYVHELENFKAPSLQAGLFSAGLESMRIIKIKDNDTISVGKIKIKVIHTPGHSPGSVCFLFDKKLLTGDTLFVGSIGRVDLPGSSEEDMAKSLKKLSRLSDDIEIYPGHDYGNSPKSTIGNEKKNNPFMGF